ncbi:MAG: hypothetical protein K2W82_09685 [Candidatus Obscuribacterales bacterium]|nr:hypothetical protein [Candidatus Obscuribacterales bacterium]
MSNLELGQEAKAFYVQLMREITVQAEELNHSERAELGELQDGISMQHIEDGWVSYKGMSWGVALQQEPVAISMTFGPDWPFVGHKQDLEPKLENDQVVWINNSDNKSFSSAAQLASYGLEMLAAKVHDSFRRF